MTDALDPLGQAHLAAIVDSSDDAIIVAGLDGIIAHWNQAAARLFGFSREDALGQPISLIFDEDPDGEMNVLLSQAAKGETVRIAETRRRNKSGGLLDVSLGVSPIRGGDGRVIGASITVRDIGERSRLRAERRLLSAIVSSADDAIISKDLGGIITSWNDAAERLLGWSATEAIGQPITIIAPDEARREEMADILNRIRAGGRVQHHETERRHKDGKLVPISLTVSPIVSDDGSVVGASKIARDIGEKRLAEERTRLLLRELDHRAKNVLTVAQAMLRLTNAERIDDFRAALEGRIRTLARVHTLVAENHWDGAELGVLVQSGAEAFHSHSVRIRRSGPTVWLSPEAAQVMGIVLHELTSNAARHGSLTATDGSVAIDWRLDDAGHVVLAWGERGGPRVEMPKRRGFGTQVIAQSVSDQLGGTSDMRWYENGLECEFTLPPTHIRKPPRGMDAAH